MFDLDGTLADTLADIAAASNYALTALGLPSRPTPAFRYLAGQGLQWLMETAIGSAHADLVPRGMELFRSYYAAHGLDQTVPYPGIADLLDAIAAGPWKTAVLSNKPHTATCLVISSIFSRWEFDAVCGQKEGVPVKPDPTSALAIASELGIEPGRWLYLGDTKVDMETACRAGFCAVGVLWGFRDEQELRASGARHVVGHPREVMALLA